MGMLRDYVPADDGMDKSQRKDEIEVLQKKLAVQQQSLTAAKLPVIVLIEGWDCAGKGALLNELIREMDPRFYRVAVNKRVPEREERFPFLKKYFDPLPENGKFLFMDTGWMEECVFKLLREEITPEEYERRVEQCRIFERQLRDNGYTLIKLFMHISRDEQSKRIDELRADADTAWRVTDEDYWQHRNYRSFFSGYERFMESTSDYTPWTILDASSRTRRTLTALRAVTGTIDTALARGRYVGRPTLRTFPLLGSPSLADADLSKSIDADEYKKELDRLQKKLAMLHNRIYRRRIPVVICYEGWDAAGKGGNIRRLSYALDPRGFDVIPVSSPSPGELARHYLWRFWTQLPKSGHVAIFDRTWYGRVMVERIEGYCKPDDWQRAYGEINEFEKALTDGGTVVLKFWLQIDPDTQLKRFNERQNTPEKQWKITDEDWRNREKWPLYEEAVEEMLQKTSTAYAPWHVVESVDKKYARIRVLQIVTDALEKATEN